MPIDLNEHLKKKRQNTQETQKDSKKDESSGGGNWNNWNKGGGDSNNFTNFVPSGRKLVFWVILLGILIILITQKPFVIINSGVG